jgi:hypothetical protein
VLTVWLPDDGLLRGDWITMVLTSLVTYSIDEFIAEWTIRRQGLVGSTWLLGTCLEGYILSLALFYHSLCFLTAMKVAFLLPPPPTLCPSAMMFLPCHHLKAMQQANHRLKPWIKIIFSLLKLLSQVFCHTDEKEATTHNRLQHGVNITCIHWETKFMWLTFLILFIKVIWNWTCNRFRYVYN